MRNKSLFGRGSFRRLPPPTSPQISFHTGHYWALGKRAAGEMVGLNGWLGLNGGVGFGNKNDWSSHGALDEFESAPLLKGLVCRFNWSDLENDAGTAYTWGELDRYFNYCKTQGKRFVLQFVYHSEDVTSAFLPTYLLNSTYEGGTFEYLGINVNGRRMCLFNQNLRNRLILLYQAIAARYNGEEYFEGIGGSETAMGNPADPGTITATKIAQYYDGMTQTLNALKTAFTGKMVYQLANFAEAGNRTADYNKLTSLCTAFRASGIALGYPDTRLDDKDLNSGLPGSPTTHPGIYYNMRNNGRGDTPNICSVQPSNYEYTGNNASDPAGHLNPTIDELYNDVLTNYPNYIFWTRHLPYNDSVITYLNGLSNPDPNIITTKPTKYPAIDIT